MLRKLLGHSTPDWQQVNEALSQLALGTPGVIRATLVTSTGLARGNLPRQTANEDRVAVMSAAVISLGERIASELGSGEMCYAVIAGNKTTQLLIVLSKDHALELELRPNVSVDSALYAAQESARVLLQAPGIETLPL